MKCVFFCFVFLVGVPVHASDHLSATEIVRRGNDLLRGEKSFSEVTMTISRPEWKRSLTMEAWTEGTEKTLIRILSPAKEKGVGFLKKGRESWQYVPAIDRVIKLPPSMMLQSWMGSDFTNDDVVRADSIVVDYTHEIVDERVEDGVFFWVIEALPKPDAPVVWGKVVLKVQKLNFVPRGVEYFDEDNELVKFYVTSDIQNVEGREIPLRFVMFDKTEENYSTSLIYKKITFKTDIGSRTFSLRKLKGL